MAILGRGSPLMGLMGLGMLGDRPEKLTPEEEKRLQEFHAKGLPIPAEMRLPDGRMVRLSPTGRILGPVMNGNPRGHYG